MSGETIVAIVNETGIVTNAIELGVKPSGVLEVVCLPSGGYARIWEGKGKHARIATRMCAGNTDLYLPALMAQLVEFSSDTDGLPTGNWHQMAMEDYDELPLSSYTRIIGVVGESFM